MKKKFNLVFFLILIITLFHADIVFADSKELVCVYQVMGGPFSTQYGEDLKYVEFTHFALVQSKSGKVGFFPLQNSETCSQSTSWSPNCMADWTAALHGAEIMARKDVYVELDTKTYKSPKEPFTSCPQNGAYDYLYDEIYLTDFDNRNNNNLGIDLGNYPLLKTYDSTWTIPNGVFYPTNEIFFYNEQNYDPENPTNPDIIGGYGTSEYVCRYYANALGACSGTELSFNANFEYLAGSAKLNSREIIVNSADNIKYQSSSFTCPALYIKTYRNTCQISPTQMSNSTLVQGVEFYGSLPESSKEYSNVNNCLSKDVGQTGAINSSYFYDFNTKKVYKACVQKESNNKDYSSGMNCAQSTDIATKVYNDNFNGQNYNIYLCKYDESRIIPTILDYGSLCSLSTSGNIGIRNAFKIVGIILAIAKLVVPLIIIIFGIIDFTKAIISSDEKALNKAAMSLLKRFIAGIVIFLIPTIVMAILDLIQVTKGIEKETNTNFGACTKCIFDPFNSCSTNNGDTTSNSTGNSG